MSWRDKDHPVWSIAKLATIFVGVNLMLWANASQFDGGEVKTAVGTVVLAAIMEALGVKRKA